MLSPDSVYKNIKENEELSLRKRILYLFLILIIGLVCVYDNILNVCFAPSLPFTELNPLCKLIMNHGGVAELIIIKSVCTIIGIFALVGLVYTKFRVCVTIMCFLSILLFSYLTFYCANGDYRISTLIQEKGPLNHFFDFYLSMDFEDNVEKLMQN